jgi:phytoene dehydrogenase-like protein
MPLATPEPLRIEHEEMRDALARASREPGAIGEEARRLARVMQPHIDKEETFALPPLGMLAELAHGVRSPEEAAAELMTRRLRKSLDDLYAEHRVIRGALEELLAAARSENRFDYAELATRMLHHMHMEEQVLYPAALMVGDYLRGVRGSPIRSSARSASSFPDRRPTTP